MSEIDGIDGAFVFGLTEDAGLQVFAPGQGADEQITTTVLARTVRFEHILGFFEVELVDLANRLDRFHLMVAPTAVRNAEPGSAVSDAISINQQVPFQHVRMEAFGRGIAELIVTITNGDEPGHGIEQVIVLDDGFGVVLVVHSLESVLGVAGLVGIGHDRSLHAVEGDSSGDEDVRPDTIRMLHFGADAQSFTQLVVFTVVDEVGEAKRTGDELEDAVGENDPDHDVDEELEVHFSYSCLFNGEIIIHEFVV